MYRDYYTPDLKRPAGRLEIVWLVLTALGLVFLLIYGLGLVFPIPMKNGESWMFGVPGFGLLFAALLCLIVLRRQGRQRNRLRAGGFPVQGRVVKTTCHVTVSYGSAGTRKRHPWTILCEYQYEGQTYTVRSTFLWDEPVGSTAKIFLDQDRPGQAWVDPSSLEYKMKLR